ncbi:MAG: ImmA/IrrE family metallo-endopeptidase [Ignavibacteriaceae bacterium]|jgi:Zn-dependent peptidase ImmA (M78 family)
MTPETKAKAVLEDYRMVKREDFDLGDILDGECLIVEEAELKNYLGRISFNSHYGLITIDRNIKEQGQKRFTLAHEVGHYFNEKDTLTRALPKGEEKALTPTLSQGARGQIQKESRVYTCTADDLFSFKVNRRREDDANMFAAELLMHRPWFSAFTAKREINFELIKETAEYFNVSLTAAAIRYATIGKYPVAIIFTRDGKKIWSYFSDYFPYKWIEKGFKVGKESTAHYFFKGKETPAEANLIPAFAWFSGDVKCRRDVYFYEQNVVMKNYGSVLTMLWESEWR